MTIRRRPIRRRRQRWRGPIGALPGNGLAHDLAHDRSGAAAVEFALVTPLLLIMVIGIVELSHWAWGAAATRDLAARTARCIAVTPDLCGSVPATRAAMAKAAPMISTTTALDFEKSACGIRVTAHGGFPAQLTPGLDDVVAVACVG
jgi:Flp pilus assembly protein TadG